MQPIVPVSPLTVETSVAARVRPERTVGRWLLPAIILGSLLLRLPGLDGALGDLDVWRQTDTAAIARNFLDEPDILRPRIDWAAPGRGYVESEFQLFPFATSLLYRVFGEDPLWGRLLSLVLTGFSCLVFFRLARRFLDERAALIAVTLFSFAPLVFRYSRAFMPEATVLLFSLIALERLLAHLDDGRWRALLASAAAMAVALLVKPTSAHLLPLLAFLVLQRRGLRGLWSPQAAAFLALALLPPLGYFAHASELYRTFGNTFGLVSGGDSKWGSLALWTDPELYRRLLTMDKQWTLGPAGLGLAALGLLGYRRPGWLPFVVFWFADILFYYLIVAHTAGFEQRGLQYHIFVVPPLALVAAAGIAFLVERVDVPAWKVVTVAMSLVLFSQLRENIVVLQSRSAVSQRAAGAALGRLARPGELALVVSHEPGLLDGLPHNFQEPEVLFHARLKGMVIPREGQTPQALDAGLAKGAVWVVNFPALNEEASPAFVAALHQRLRLVQRGEGFEIFTARRDAPAPSAPAPPAAAPPPRVAPAVRIPGLAGAGD